jgi:pimeloyl-ACP methyl ester carboxylesterase
MAGIRGALGWAAAAAVGGALVAAARARPVPETHAAPDPPPGLPPARTIAVPGHGELWLRDAGAAGAPPVVLLHGWMFPSDLNWSPCYASLAEGHRVIAPDARGHGRGTRPATPFRLVDVADDVAALLRHLDVEPAVVVGYSMGGSVAQQLALRHPDVVRGLVLCATAAHLPYWYWRGMGLVQLVLRLLPRHWWERATIAQAEGRSRVQVSRMLTPDLPDETLAYLPWMIGELSRGSAEDLAEAGRELGRFDSRGWVGGLRPPAAVIVTARDRLVRPHLQRELAAALPDAALFELDLDHNAVAAGTDEFLAALLKAIAHVSGEATRH